MQKIKIIREAIESELQKNKKEFFKAQKKNDYSKMASLFHYADGMNDALSIITASNKYGVAKKEHLAVRFGNTLVI